jgi:hypothetical protein
MTFFPETRYVYIAEELLSQLFPLRAAAMLTTSFILFYIAAPYQGGGNESI